MSGIRPAVCIQITAIVSTGRKRRRRAELLHFIGEKKGIRDDNTEENYLYLPIGAAITFGERFMSASVEVNIEVKKVKNKMMMIDLMVI